MLHTSIGLQVHILIDYWLSPTVASRIIAHRAERRKDQVCSSTEYQKVFERLDALPQRVEHVVVQLGELILPLARVTHTQILIKTGIPIAYPRLTFLETFLDSKMNPLVALGRKGALGMSGFVNKFNAEAELLDDLVSRYIQEFPRVSTKIPAIRTITGLRRVTRWSRLQV
jgi:hypothetical protein